MLIQLSKIELWPLVLPVALIFIEIYDSKTLGKPVYSFTLHYYLHKYMHHIYIHIYLSRYTTDGWENERPNKIFL